MIYKTPKLFVVSDTACCVEYGDSIDEQLSRKVAALTQMLDDTRPAAVIEVVPTYRSVMVEYDPVLMNHEQMAALLLDMAGRVGGDSAAVGRTVEIPVCYGGAYGPDLQEVAAEVGLSEQAVIDIHSGGSYPVYMMGFTPGFPYLGGMDTRIAAPRLATPRTLIPGGSVGIAGEQTGIYPLASPGGWRLIGRTPLSLFDKGSDTPFLLSAGDRVRFVPVDEATYLNMGGEQLA